jgi:Ni/Co efflux regulator RcnB
MRRALIGILMAATVATPLAAQDGNWRGRYERAGERNAARAERQEQRQEARPQSAERQQRFEQQRQQAVQAQQVQAQQVQAQQVQAQQQGGYRTRGGEGRQSYRGGNGGAWQGRDGGAGQAEMQRRIDSAREASRTSVQGAPANYRRQAERNVNRYEQQVRQDYRRDRSGGDLRRDGRDGRNDRSGYGGDRYGSNGGWNRGWRNDNRYDWQRYRTSNRSLFHSGRYYAPYRNYNYNRLSIGLVLDSLFYSQNYWIGDPWQYRLPPAPYGTQWVRYYDDVVLVDVYDGEVLDVIYDFFW